MINLRGSSCFRTGFLRTGMAVLMCLSLSACASSRQDASEVYDPLESVNRATFAVNDAFDRALLKPVARGYRAVVPKPARTGVRNFLRNLRSPVNIANQVLQGDVEGAASDFTRMAINSTIGFGGLIDVAEDFGLPYEQEDFGQTLGVWGLDHGPYLVLPIIGPSSVRDTVGLVVDSYADPLRLYLYNTNQEEWHYVRLGATAIDRREELLEVLDELQKSSFDYYAAMRSTYVQHRDALVRDGSSDMSASIPDYDEENGDE